MQSLKIACSQCACHAECPQRVRLFVNYCGADHKKLDTNIRLAILECRLRRGHFLRQALSLRSDAASVFGPQVVMAS